MHHDIMTAADRGSSAAGSPPPGAAADHDASLVVIEDELYFASRRAPRDPRRLPTLLLDAIRLVWSTNRPSTLGTVTLQLTGALIASVQVLLAGYAVQELVRGGLKSISVSLVLALVALGVTALIGGLSSAAGEHLGRLLGVQVTRRVTDDVLDVTTRVDLIDYDDPDFHNHLNRVLATMPTQPYAVVSSMAALIGGVIGTVSLTVTLAVINPLLVVVLLAVGLPLWLVSRRTGRMEFALAVEQTANQRERAYMVELLTRRENAAEARAFGTAAVLRRRFARSYDEYIDAVRQLIRRRYLLAGVSTAVSAVAIAITLLALVWLVSRGSVDVRQAASALVGIRLLSTRVTMVFGGIGSLFQSGLFLADFRDFTSRVTRGVVAPAVSAERAAASSDGQQDVSLSLRGVSFRYPGAPGAAVDDVSIELHAGEIVALVGENGSGKTTLAKLLAGLYEPTAGQIDRTIGGRSGASAAEGTAATALVLQDFARYQFTVNDNIAFGRPERPRDEAAVRDAAVRAGLADVVARLPRGYDTRLSRQFAGGRDLSIGQWQRMAIARAYYRDSGLVVLDEPAAALDPRAEAQLYDSVGDLLRGRTVVMVTHRLRSVRAVDRIIVLDRGRVVEDGNHETLMKRNGHYADLVRVQESAVLQGLSASGGVPVTPLDSML